MRPSFLLAIAWFGMTSYTAVAVAEGTEVTGRIDMPSTCAPEISPAVVKLERADHRPIPATTAPSRPAHINQRGLRFDPRVVALTAGQPIRFGNEDPETHNVHILVTGPGFNESISPGKQVEFVPKTPGLLRVVCDVHSHMRAFVVVGNTPWITTCDRSGKFRFDGVPEGRYRLTAWHEMGEPLVREVEVSGSPVELGAIAMAAKPVSLAAGSAAPVEPWAEVIDHISQTLAQSLDASRRPDGRRLAERLAQDAYLGHFEASDMETAVRAYLGLQRSTEIEEQFRAVRLGVRGVAEGKASQNAVVGRIRGLLGNLSRAASELDKKGISNRSKVLVADAATPPTATPAEGRQRNLNALQSAFSSVRELADRGEAQTASLAMGDAYFDAFEPLELELKARDMWAVRRLEGHFNRIRGDLDGGLKGEPLATALAGLRGEVKEALEKGQTASASAFLLAFTASLGTILREGIEVILLLTMLFALVAKAGEPRALRALRWGVGLGAVASVLTAVALSLLVGATKGRSREMLEGVVLLAASGILFYVSYWLISQSESKRWLDFLKKQARQGAELGGFATLGLTAFLAIYREGAETALMYQAMLAQQTRDGLLGVGAGLAVGLALLGVVYVILRVTSVRLPLRTFFQVTGFLLFTMAVIFAGHGVAELQTSRVLRWTSLSWLGDGLPALGIYPNLQCLAVQGILVAGGALALVLSALPERRPAAPKDSGRPSQMPPPRAAGVGV